MLTLDAILRRGTAPLPVLRWPIVERAPRRAQYAACTEAIGHQAAGQREDPCGRTRLARLPHGGRWTGDLSPAQTARKSAVAVRQLPPSGVTRFRPRAPRHRRECARAYSRMRRPALRLRAHPLRRVRSWPAARLFSARRAISARAAIRTASSPTASGSRSACFGLYRTDSTSSRLRSSSGHSSPAVRLSSESSAASSRGH